MRGDHTPVLKLNEINASRWLGPAVLCAALRWCAFRHRRRHLLLCSALCGRAQPSPALEIVTSSKRLRRPRRRLRPPRDWTPFVLSCASPVYALALGPASVILLCSAGFAIRSRLLHTPQRDLYTHAQQKRCAAVRPYVSAICTIKRLKAIPTNYPALPFVLRRRDSRDLRVVVAATALIGSCSANREQQQHGAHGVRVQREW